MRRRCGFAWRCPSCAGQVTRDLPFAFGGGLYVSKLARCHVQNSTIQMNMIKLPGSFCCLTGLGVVHALAQEVTHLEKIGPVVSIEKGSKAVTFNCGDNSQ